MLTKKFNEIHHIKVITGYRYDAFFENGKLQSMRQIIEGAPIMKNREIHYLNADDIEERYAPRNQCPVNMQRIKDDMERGDAFIISLYPFEEIDKIAFFKRLPDLGDLKEKNAGYIFVFCKTDKDPEKSELRHIPENCHIQYIHIAPKTKKEVKEYTEYLFRDHFSEEVVNAFVKEFFIQRISFYEMTTIAEQINARNLRVNDPKDVRSVLNDVQCKDNVAEAIRTFCEGHKYAQWLNDPESISFEEDSKTFVNISGETALERIGDILEDPTVHNIQLVSPAGSGKTELVKEFGRRHPETRIIAVSPDEMLAGSGIVGTIEERYTELVEFVRKNELVLFIDESHRLMSSGGAQNGGNGVDFFKTSLLLPDFHVIAATTPEEYESSGLANDKPNARRFWVLHLKSMSDEDVRKILRVFAKEKFGYIFTDEELLGYIIESSKLIERYPTMPAAPKKLLSLALTQVRLHGGTLTKERIDEICKIYR